VLGEGARQAGSLVAPDRLRFDFHHDRPLTATEIAEIERRVNAWVLKAVPTEIVWRDRDEAVQAGAMALFGEKYGERVRTVEVPGVSLELCGGCHVRNTGEIGPLIVTAERGTASGVRRIEAIAGEVALAELRRRQELLREVEAGLGVEAERAPREAAALKERIKELERELAGLRRELLAGKPADGGESEVAGVRVVAREVPGAPAGELRSLADTLRDKMGSGVVVLGTRGEGKVTLIVTVSKDLTGRVDAGRLVRSLAAQVGGSGGGRPDFAQAGGKQPENLPSMLAKVPEVLAQQLGAV
jgi:alanyl-tRNA synthetase